MSSKKYQVFISSTYTDLVDERKAVEETIIRAGDFPVGMESFPAADEEQFEFIKTVILKCDYYVLIIAGRYGSLAADGFSYTEKEYDFAVANGIPVLVMLHASLGSLQVDKSESTEEGRKKLAAFIEKTSKGRIRKNWVAQAELKLAVREALDHAKATKPRPGWIRGDTQTSAETLSENILLRKELDQAHKIIAENSPKISDMAGLDAVITVRGTREIVAGRNGYGSAIYRTGNWELEASFSRIFGLIAPKLIGHPSDDTANALIAKNLCETIGKSDGKGFEVDDQVFQTVKIQLEALGLITVKRSQSTSGHYGVFWNLTDAGKAKMLDLRVIRKEA